MRAEMRVSKRKLRHARSERPDPFAPRARRATTRIDRWLMAFGLAGITGGAWFAVTAPAGAAYPGVNGDIAFFSTRSSMNVIWQVNPTGANGTAAGDQAATTELTNGGGADVGGIDAEPFYSPDGQTVFFDSNRTGNWVIFSVPQATPEPPAASELSQPSGANPATSPNDYGPSVASDSKTVVFQRTTSSGNGNGGALYTLYTGAANVAASVCLLYTPPDGLLSPSASAGSASRAVFDPVDPSKLVYTDASGHLHLLSGIPTPELGGSPTNPCSVNPSSLTDTDLSTTADQQSGPPVTTGYQDEDPDWSPDGTKLIFDSTRNGGQTIWTMTGGILSGSGTLSANPLWNSLANSSGPQIQYQPVFSPDGTQIAYAEATRGSSVFSADLVNMDQSYTNAENLSLSTPGNPANSEPDWQPLSTGNGTPEAPMILLLPGSALLIGGIALTIQGRRRRVPGSGVTV